MTGSEEDSPPTLSIGTIFGGTPEVDEFWQPHIRSLRRLVMRQRDLVERGPLCVNVVYFVGGRLIPLRFEGVRTGTFSRKTMHLMVQAAISPLPQGDPRGTLLALLQESVAAAEGYAKRKKIADALPEIRSIVSVVERDVMRGSA